MAKHEAAHNTPNKVNVGIEAKCSQYGCEARSLSEYSSSSAEISRIKQLQEMHIARKRMRRHRFR